MDTPYSFISQILKFIQDEAAAREYVYPSAIIAQACIESNFGRSLLASKYYNFFGMKCGSAWKGANVNLKTKEEYTPGTLTNIRDNFRVYSSTQEGIKGYFDFISSKRYSNLKSATSSRNFIELIKADGYATSANYVKNVYAIVEKYNLLQYDTGHAEPDDLANAINIIAQYVINGYFGNGHETRKNAIYNLIRKEVNKNV